MDNVTFHSASRSDAKLLSTLFKTVYLETYAVEGITDEFSDFIEHQFSKSKIEKAIDGNSCKLWIAKYKGNPVGVLQLDYQKDCPVRDFSAPEINKLYILRNFYGRGIGQKLMQLAENHLRKEGYHKVWLWVYESNQRAINFYNNQGFQTIGIADFQMAVNKYTNKVMLKEYKYD